MPPENKTALEPGGSEGRVYYVEDVDGDDFTFYLSANENETLLREETPDRDGQKQPPKGNEQEQLQKGGGQERQPKERFSYSKTLTVVRCSPLYKTDDVLDARKFVSRLKHVIENPKIVLERRVKRTIQKLIKSLQADPSDDFLRKIIEELNKVLKGRGKTAFNYDCERIRLGEGLEKFSKRGQSACKRRHRFDKIFTRVVKPFQPDLTPVTGRAIISRSYQGELLSVTFRKKSAKSSYEPDKSKKFSISLEEYCAELYRAIRVTEMRGLLVITGATNSAKSEIATGLIYKYLEEWKQKHKGKGRPHLVTFEDPVEKFYASVGDGERSAHRSVETPAVAERGVNYTPREKGDAGERRKDVESLREALADALRQTPTVFFVGETREKLFWRLLIDFAGTGHLIVTTSHAGSLTEAMHKIFEALKVRTPAERSEIANRLLGVIHIKRQQKILVPALWRRTSTGKNALTAEGLSSLLPYTPEEGDVEKGCLGRFWFARRLVTYIAEPERSEVEAGILKDAVAWDLEGV
jgi:Type II/IV secretion system protein